MILDDDESGGLEDFVEPKIKWKKSQAKQVLYQCIMDGTVPEEAKDSNGRSTMAIRDIYLLHEEFAKYEYDKFSSRLRALQTKIKELNNRAEDDLQAFEIYKENHTPSLYSHKGYIQWQGSNAQELLWIDMEAGKHKVMKPKALWESRQAYLDEFPLYAFRSKLEQEIRTAKYVHTIKERGIEHRAS